ncbi:MAG: response regulator transcription factor [Proteobacteria bacterium]|nr:response regulator transcription factor [Pseudomonadota bacterium]
MDTLILIVEDEPDLVASLEYNLQREGYGTRAALTGTRALELVRRDPKPDLVLLDLMLPDMSGKDVCRQIRADAATRDIPVIMVTARTEEVDRIIGLELGADDYVTKPYSIRELMLRVKAVLRRRGAPPDDDATGPRVFGRLRIDEDAHRVWVDDALIELTALEFRLLSMLLARRGRVQTRDVLLEEVWGVRGDSNTRTVDTHVKRLRQKLGAAGSYVETIRGVGYRFTDRP